jgi:hypothetical protein
LFNNTDLMVYESRNKETTSGKWSAANGAAMRPGLVLSRTG